MKAVVQDRYGPPEVLRVEEVARPVPGDDEVLVRVHASTVNQTDAHFRSPSQPLTRILTGVRRPRRRITGRDFAGTVDAVGARVTRFAVGDRVFGIRSGANAEYVAVRQTRLIARMPRGMSFEDAAAIPDGAYQAFTHLSRAGVGTGTRLLVYGASGSCGSASVQVAKAWGAHVTGVTSTKNVELVRSLGADVVIDYRTEDFTKNGQLYDVILDAVGKLSFRRTRRSLRPGGLWVATDGLLNLLWWGWTRFVGDRRLVFATPRQRQDDLVAVRDLIEAGRYRAVVDRVYPLDQVVEAHRYVDTWRKVGNVVLSIDGLPGPSATPL